MEDGQKTGICGKCPEYCEECDDDHSICIKCEDGAGFILDEKRKKKNQANVHYACQKTVTVQTMPLNVNAGWAQVS